MSSTQKSTAEIFDWVLRLIESMAFSIHGVLGVTEPCTGCLRNAFGDTHGAMPNWSWPVAGVLLWTVAAANFSKNDAAVLAAQAYVASFHTGAFFYHRALGHHFVAGLPPTIFAVFAFGIVWLRLGSFLVALFGLVVCTGIAFLLSKVLVTPPPSQQEPETNLLAAEIGGGNGSGATHQNRAM